MWLLRFHSGALVAYCLRFIQMKSFVGYYLIVNETFFCAGHIKH